MHKDIEKILYSEKDIENIVNTIAKQIEKDYNDKDFIMVGLLKGSVAFMVDLMRKVNLDFSIDFIVASTLSSNNQPIYVVDGVILDNGVSGNTTADWDAGANNAELVIAEDDIRIIRDKIAISLREDGTCKSMTDADYKVK